MASRNLVQLPVKYDQSSVVDCGESTYQSPTSSRSRAGTARTVVDGIEERLRDREDAASEVEQHLINTPAQSALAIPVHVRLRHVFDERDAELDVAKEVHVVEPRDDGEAAEDQQHVDDEPRRGHERHAQDRVHVVGSFLRSSPRRSVCH